MSSHFTIITVICWFQKYFAFTVKVESSTGINFSGE